MGLSAEHFRLLFHHLTASVLVEGDAGQLLYVNPAAEALFGYAADELVGGPSERVCVPAPDTGSELAEASSRAPYRRRDGVTFLGETLVCPIQLGEEAPQGRLLIVRVASVMEQSLDVLQRLHAITTSGGMGFETRMAEILKLGSDHFGLPLGIQSRIDGHIYVVEHCHDVSGGLQPGLRFDLDNTYCMHTLLADGPTGFHHAGESDIREHPCYKTFQLEAYLGCPIVVDGERYGTLNFSRAEASRPFAEDDLAFIRLLADWVGNTISKERSRCQLEVLANTDALTGMLNRRALMEDLCWQIEHARRSELPLAVVMFDLDHFKRINDTYGHDIGDDVIRAVAEVCEGLSRSVDRCSRWGGEEFLLVLPDTTEGGALSFSERLLAAIQAQQIALPEGDMLTVTASLGVTMLRPEESAEALISRADKAMYAAKISGRAQVRVAA